MYKFLVIGGLHGNEPLGLEVCRKLEKLRLPFIDVLYGNKKAIRANKRFIEQDLNRVFPGNNMSYEGRRAKQIMGICKKYDFVIDFHNTNCPSNNSGFVGGSEWQKAANLASFLKLKKLIVADYDCINKYVKNCLSVEISLGDKLCNANYWIEKLSDIRSFKAGVSYVKVELFRFSYRITREQQSKFGFPKWKAFKPIPKKDLNKLGLRGAYYPIFIDDAYTPYNYAGLIQKLKGFGPIS